MKDRLKSIYYFVKNIVQIFNEQDPVVYAGAIAFFTLFSLPSALMIIIQSLGTILSKDEIRSQLANQISGLIGAASTEEILTIVENRGWEYSSILGNIVGLVFLFISATAVFNFIQKALNSIWNVKPQPKKVVKRFLIDRLLSFSIITIIGFLLMVTLVLDAAMSIFKEFLYKLITKDFSMYIVEGANLLISLLIISTIFALVFKFLPDAKIKWRDVSVGAIVTGILFMLGKFAIGLILSNSQITSTYGAAGSLAGILVWVFYSSILVLIGAIFTRVYAEEIGHDIKPQSHAVLVDSPKEETIES
ncbi:YihY/virulence factor BrkB family protein [Marinoscillum pacificum]|uniref:YihY/virulence factor BrkB family protein n=1 Tax=Marinoscillum pacificum TaxID=392723 RepID=UPI002158409D|nr:YihY/virulence factor BrkB family protein [Marinoscillum pacificum]